MKASIFISLGIYFIGIAILVPLKQITLLDCVALGITCGIVGGGLGYIWNENHDN